MMPSTISAARTVDSGLRLAHAATAEGGGPLDGWRPSLDMLRRSPLSSTAAHGPGHAAATDDQADRGKETQQEALLCAALREKLSRPDLLHGGPAAFEAAAELMAALCQDLGVHSAEAMASEVPLHERAGLGK